MQSEPIEYILDDIYQISTLSRLKCLISNETKTIIDSLYCCILRNEETNAYLLNSDEDLLNFKQFAQENNYTKAHFYYVHIINPLISNELDFEIIVEKGISQCSTVKIGSNLIKEWIIKTNTEIDELLLVCVEGEFEGVNIIGLDQGNNIYILSININIIGTQRWSSSLWRAYSNKKFFGPSLWIEMNFSK